MAHDGNIITGPGVGILADLQPVLGTSETKLGRIISRANINWRSKMKPVPFISPAPDRNAVMSAYGKNLWWWQGHPSYTEVDAGLVIGNYTTIDKAAWFTSCGCKFLGFLSRLDVLRAFDPIHNQYHTGDASPLKDNYSLVRPVGGLTVEPHRLRDFLYYKHDADYNIIPDAGTESGTQLINPNNPESSRVACGVMSQSVVNSGAPSELSFSDIFDAFGNQAGFTVVLGKLAGSQFNLVSLSVSTTKNDPYFKEVAINLNDSQAIGSTVIAMYCAYIPVGTETYYVPLMQSSYDRPNTPISYAPKRKMFASWAVQSMPYYSMAVTQKQNYGSAYAFTSIGTMTYLDSRGLMNRWYLKLSMPHKTSTYSFGANAFKIEFTGEFRDSRGQLKLVYYSVRSSSAGIRFVLKNSEVEAYDWGTTETVTVAPGSGVQNCYLAIYTLFADRDGAEVTNGGTIWRIRVFFLNGQADFSSEPDIVFGGLDAATRLSINVPATQ